MKAIAATIVIFVILSIPSHAQIPNNGFERWIPVNNCIEPANWYGFYSLIDSTGIYCPVRRSTDHYPAAVGNYSARICNDTALWNSGVLPRSFLGWGVLSSTKLNDQPLFPVTGHPTSLCGYYKFFPENGDTMNVYVHLYKNGAEVASGSFQDDRMISTWTPFQIFLNDTSYLSADSARILFSASNEPKGDKAGPLGNSVLFVDNLSFDALITSVGQNPNELPDRFDLSQNFPNPFNPVTTISYQIPTQGHVSLKVFDVLGREVAVLVDGVEEPGYKSVEFAAEKLSSGVYYYRLTADSYSETRKLLLVR